MAGSESQRSSIAFSSNHGLNHGYTDQSSLLTDLQLTCNVNPCSVPSSSEPDGDCSLYHTGNFFHAVLKYINDMLMDEDLGDKPCIFQDSVALQAAEKSFYDVLGGKYPPQSDQVPPCFIQNGKSQYENFVQSSSVDCTANNFSESNWTHDQSFLGGDSLSVMKFNNMSQNVIRNPENLAPLHEAGQPAEVEEVLAQAAENGESISSSNRSKGRKNPDRESDGRFEESRSNKYASIFSLEYDELEIIDNGFLTKVENKEQNPCPLFDASRNEACKRWQQYEQLQASNVRMKRLISSRDMVDLWSLLTSCAQAVGSGNGRSANQHLNLLRKHSSPYGDGNQRMAHYFANGLEARLAGTGSSDCEPGGGSSTITADMLKAYRLYVSICPFRRLSNRFANKTIVLAAEKGTRLHIIDFGIGYGFQWPCFLNRISRRPGGPPKIRMTGIDFPQPGFRPAGLVEETGRRLKRLAAELKVPFEFNAIAQKWETIRYEDLKIDRDEIIVVNAMYGFRYLPDDMTVPDSSRDAVLKLIRKINPEVFVHVIVNGYYNAPFFATRFREALFNYSAFFDMLEANAAREDQERLIFEREFLGKAVVNVVACEGKERVERPETYKQWQARNSRNGFRQLPLDRDLAKNVKELKSDFHKDFVVDEDREFMLLGWKGRVIQALSAWKAVQE